VGACASLVGRVTPIGVKLSVTAAEATRVFVCVLPYAPTLLAVKPKDR